MGEPAEVATMAAAEQLERTCVGHEEDPKFCAVILERMTTLGLSVEKLNAAEN